VVAALDAKQEAVMEYDEAKKVGEVFVRALETNERGELFAEDVFVDINIPEWRFQMMGTTAVDEWLAAEQPSGCRVASWDTTPTADGLLVEIEQRYGEELSRNLHRLEVREGKIVCWTMYCTGIWSAETQERQKREAPMLRP
jgi:hypothetical protein